MEELPKLASKLYKKTMVLTGTKCGPGGESEMVTMDKNTMNL
jgi:hypothetical protein